MVWKYPREKLNLVKLICFYTLFTDMKFLQRQTTISYLGGSARCPHLLICDLILLAVVLLFCFLVYANNRVIQSQLTDCEVTDINAYLMCFGMFENDKFKYEGEWKNGLRDNIGMLLDRPLFMGPMAGMEFHI